MSLESHTESTGSLSIEQFHAAVQAKLLSLGWAASRGSAIAIKSYPTTVGDKEAHVYLFNPGKDSTSYHLSGVYITEGYDALGNQGILIDRDVSPEELNAKVERFSLSADLAVSQTYAARLLARGIDKREQPATRHSVER